MAISIINIVSMLKEIVSDEGKLGKVKEIISDVKELIKDLKDLTKN